MLQFIEDGVCFEGNLPDDSLTVKVNRYVPYCCTAIHAGANLRASLSGKIALSDYERWYEEDPLTDEFIISMPITIVCNDSRYEYDLNRPENEAIYETAWDKKVWKRALTPKERKESLKKHRNYYKIMHTLIEKLESMFGGAVVYDFHSYNHKRYEEETPVINIGTENIDNNRYNEDVNSWVEQLQQLDFGSEIDTTVKVNDLFYGRGYNLEYITKHFPNTLVLATEIKKIYCDELTGDIYSKVVNKLKQQFKKIILKHANSFCVSLDKWKHISSVNLLDKTIDKTLLSVDKGLYKLVRNFELLAAVNPINLPAEKRLFFRNKFNYNPKFKYSPIKINTYELKQKLRLLDVNNIHDISIKNMYENTIDSYSDKVDLISTLGTKKFLYNSLRYFGRPSQKDIKNANYILHLPYLPSDKVKEPEIDVQTAIALFKESLDNYGLTQKIELSNKVVSQVMVLNSKKRILFRPDATFRRKELLGLIEHEIGVHMVTSVNASQQKLKIFSVGHPLNTHTQEGLAVFAEYLSGNLTLRRLKKFALRVIAVDNLCNGATFSENFQSLLSINDSEANEIYDICVRVYRGGGFTKDHLYLSGFVKILNLHKKQVNLNTLLVGKTNHQYIATIEEMINRGMVEAPKLITKSFEHDHLANIDPIYEYILSGLK